MSDQPTPKEMAACIELENKLRAVLRAERPQGSIAASALLGAYMAVHEISYHSRSAGLQACADHLMRASMNVAREAAEARAAEAAPTNPTHVPPQPGVH